MVTYNVHTPHTPQPPEGFTSIRCLACEGWLSGPNGPRPAETHLGTSTGLCYECQGSGPYLESTDAYGRQRWSFPPHSPSWRRRRETFTGFAGCEVCNETGVEQSKHGHGPLRYPNRWGMGGWKRCGPCSQRSEAIYTARDVEAAVVSLTVNGYLATEPDPREGDRASVKVAVRLDRLILHEDDYYEADGYYSATPGLVVHAQVRKGDNGEWEQAKRGAWSITHEASGLAVSQSSAKTRAFAIARDLNGVADWTASKEQLYQDKKLLSRIYTVRSLHEG